MNDAELDRQLSAYRNATSSPPLPVDLVCRVLAKLPQRASTRRSLHEARMACVLALCLGAGGGLWATLETLAIERQLFVQITVWADGP